MMTRILFNFAVAVLTIIPLLTIDNQPHILSLDFLEEAEQFTYDYRLKDSISHTRVGGGIHDEIRIIDIDQESITRLGNWPWRRDKTAEFISDLTDLYNVKLIVITDAFTERLDFSSALLNDLRDRFYYDGAIQNALDQIEPEYNFDLRLINELDGRPVLLGFEFDPSKRQLGRLPNISEPFSVSGNPIASNVIRSRSSQWVTYPGYTSSNEDFLERALGAGFMNFNIDSDGQIRSYSLIAKYGGENYPSLALAAVRMYDNPRQPSDLVLEIGGSSSAFEEIGTKDYLSKIDTRGNTLLNFTGFGGRSADVFQYYSAHEIKDGSIPVDDLAGKVVFIGSSSEVVNDLWSTPVNSRMPGVELHALALMNMIEGTSLSRPQNAWILEGFLLILIGVLMSLGYTKLRMVFVVFVTVAGLFATYYINYNVLWLNNQEVYRLIPFCALFVVMMLANFISVLAVEYRAKKKVEGVLNQYIPPELAKEVNTSKKGFSMEGEIREMSILFSDVRGFTSISERLKPHELTELMNKMLTILSQQIHVNRGTIDKYIGDAVMAFWNAPLDDAKHATNAVLGALGMQDAMEKLSVELVAKGMPELKMGVGINTGEACVGNMGSAIRLSYTVMGDTVNLASRLEGITKQYGVRIIVGERTYDLTKDDFLYRPVDAVRVKGKEQAVRIFEPMCSKQHATPSDYQLQDGSHQYWESYQQRHFGDAVSVLKELLAEYPDDGLLNIYLNRTLHFMEAPPPDDWDAVTTFDTK